MIKKITLIILFAFLLGVALSLHPFARPVSTEMDDYFIQNAQRQTGSNNVVSGIVFDYRGLDTIGEAAVLFAAVMGVSLIFAPWGAGFIKKKYD